MKKTNKLALLSVTTLLGMGMMTGCGGRNNNDGITVIMWHTFGQTIQETLERKIEEFEKLVLDNEGVKVNVEQHYRGGYDDILNNIENGLAVGNVPTIAVAYPDHVANYLNIQKDVVVNLDQYIYDEQVGFGMESWLGDRTLSANEGATDDFIPAYIEEGRSFVYEGTYLLPLMKSTEVMFYNVNVVEPLLDAMEKLDESDPYYLDTTRSNTQSFLSSLSWDQLMLIGEYALVWDERPNSLEYPIFYDSDSNLFITKMMQNNIPYSSVDYTSGKGQIDFIDGDARTNAEEMVGKLKESYDKGVLTTKGSVGQYGSNYFVESKAIFSIGSSGGTGYQLPSSDTFKVGVCMVPADNKNPLYVCQGPDLVMLRSSTISEKENDDRNLYAWKFMKYLTNPDVNVELCTYGSEGYSPVRQSAYTTSEYLKYLEWGEDYAETAKVVISDIGTKYFTTAVFPGSATLRDEVGGIVTTVLKQNTNIKDAFETAINQSLLSMQGS